MKRIELFLNPIAGFSDSSDYYTVVFTNTSQNATSYLWNFGDGNTSSAQAPTHTYVSSNTYECFTV